MTSPNSPESGFTLIEVLVAVAIVAVALLAGLQSTGALSHQAQRQTAALLGQICAENEWVRLRLLRQLPDVGHGQHDCMQAGRPLQVRLHVQSTPNPNFRRVDAQVFEQAQPVLQLSTVTGKQP